MNTDATEGYPVPNPIVGTGIVTNLVISYRSGADGVVLTTNGTYRLKSIDKATNTKISTDTPKLFILFHNVVR